MGVYRALKMRTLRTSVCPACPFLWIIILWPQEDLIIQSNVSDDLLRPLYTRLIDRPPVWDIRAFKKPLAVNDQLTNLNSETNVIFSPDENYILTGTAGKAVTVGNKQVDLAERAAAAGHANGQLAVLRRSDLQPVQKLSISQGSVIKTVWNQRINQILLTTSIGSTHVLYNPETSTKGVTLALGRTGKPRSTAADEGAITGTILTPHALPMFQDDARLMGKTGKRKREKERQDPSKTMKPLPPMSGPGRGGRVGASATQHIVQGLVFNNTRDEDVRYCSILLVLETC